MAAADSLEKTTSSARGACCFLLNSLSSSPSSYLRVAGDGAALGVEERQCRVHFGVHGSFFSRAREPALSDAKALKRKKREWGRERQSEKWVERAEFFFSLFFFPLSIASQSFFQNAPTNMASDDERRVQMQLQQELQVAYMQEFYSVSGASRESGGGGREEKRRRRRRRSAVPFAMQQEQRRPLPLFSLLLAFSLCLWFQIHQGYALNEREREMTRKATEKTNGKTSTHFLSSRPLFFRPPLDDLLFTPNLQTLSLSLSFLAAAPPFSTSSLSKKKNSTDRAR